MSSRQSAICSLALSFADKCSQSFLVLLNALPCLVAVLWSKCQYHCTTRKKQDKCTDLIDDHVTWCTHTHTHTHTSCCAADDVICVHAQRCVFTESACYETTMPTSTKLLLKLFTVRAKHHFS